MLSNCVEFKLNKTIKKEVARQVKALAKENKIKDYHVIYVAYDIEDEKFIVSDDYFKVHTNKYIVYSMVEYYLQEGVKTIEEYEKEIFS